MLVTALRDIACSRFAIKRGATSEVPDELGRDLVRVGHAQPAPSGEIETLQLNQAATGTQMSRKRRNNMEK